MGMILILILAISSSKNSSFSNQILTGSLCPVPVSTLSVNSEDERNAGRHAFLSSSDSRYRQSSVYP